jgi:nucleoside-diphosphate-sugar epimerase
LLDDGWDVAGIDRFTDAYSPSLKRRNVSAAVAAGLDLYEGDIVGAPLDDLLAGADVVFHLAAVPGVRASWDEGFDAYTHNNITATQRLLEAIARAERHPRVVYASSSSVYGNADDYPVAEDVGLRPHSPYGLTKLAAEHLVGTYARNFSFEAVSLRFFSVFGPRQRPDMGIHKLIEAALQGRTFTVYGDGSQVRDMTYVSDVVQGLVQAATSPDAVGAIANIAGGCIASLREVIDLVSAEVGEIDVEYGAEQLGDVKRTGGRIERALAFGFEPTTELEAGIRAQIAWHREEREVLEAATID